MKTIPEIIISEKENFGIPEVKKFISSLKDERYEKEAPAFTSIPDGESLLMDFLVLEWYVKDDSDYSYLVFEFIEFYEKVR